MGTVHYIAHIPTRRYLVCGKDPWWLSGIPRPATAAEIEQEARESDGDLSLLPTILAWVGGMSVEVFSSNHDFWPWEDGGWERDDVWTSMAV